MSLNGLGSEQIQQAFDTATAEASGWFFLHYVSRDTVELLASGKSGVSEARTAAAEYTEKSPLYGLLNYRRRRVLIRYIPEGTSRLLQARTKVHIQDLLDKYAPYESLLDITSPDSLSDTHLAASFPLHTATPAVSTSKLDEITEAGEDAPAASRPKAPEHSSSTTSVTTRRAALDRRIAAKRKTSPPTSSMAQMAIEKPPAFPSSQQKSSLSQFLLREESGRHSVTPLSSPDITDYAALESPAFDSASVKSGNESTLSSIQPVRIDSADTGTYLTYDEYDFKPKVRLAPRPVTVSDHKRNASSGGAARPTSGLTSSLPAAVRKRTSRTDLRTEATPQSASDEMAPSRRLPVFPRPSPVLDSPDYTMSRPTSRGSMKSFATTRSSKTLTPEKQRLLKAVEMRKKQMQKSLGSAQTTPEIAQCMPEVPTQASEGASDVQELRSRAPSTANKSDSGIAMDFEKPAESVESSPPSVEILDHPDALRVRTGEASNHVITRQTGALLDPESDDTGTDATRGLGIQIGHATTIAAPVPTTAAEVHSTQRDEQDELQLSGLDDESPGSEVLVESPELSSKQEEARKKRRGMLEPLQLKASLHQRNTSATSAFSLDDDYPSDEDFMAELQNATLQEATPVSVSKSPFFPRHRSITSINSTVSDAALGSSTISRSPSNAVDKSQPITFGKLSRTDSREEILFASKTNVSSGISQRIATLAERSNKEPTGRSTSASSQNLAPESSTASKGFLAIRKVSNQASRPSSTSRNGNQQVGDGSQTVYTVQADPTTNRDSVSVTARIVRQPGNAEGGPTPMVHSPLIIDHKRATGAPSGIEPFTPMVVDNTAADAKAARRLSPPVATRASSISPTLSYSSLESFVRGSGAARRTSEAKTTASSRGASANSEASSEMPEKSSRTSRFFKRMSALGGGNKRRSQVIPESGVPLATPEIIEPVTRSATTSSAAVTPIIPSPTLPEAAPSRMATVPSSPAVPSPAPTTPRDVPPPLVLGDMNVQFPDNMLWKRRWAEIDGAGVLTFSLSRGATNSNSSNTAAASNSGSQQQQRASTSSSAVLASVKRFHLRDFLAPYVPDLDAQELPNSVVMDMVDGRRTLMCACEDGVAQRQLLALLKTYHEAWLAA